MEESAGRGACNEAAYDQGTDLGTSYVRCRASQPLAERNAQVGEHAREVRRAQHRAGDERRGAVLETDGQGAKPRGTRRIHLYIPGRRAQEHGLEKEHECRRLAGPPSLGPDAPCADRTPGGEEADDQAGVAQQAGVRTGHAQGCLGANAGEVRDAAVLEGEKRRCVYRARHEGKADGP